MSLLKDARMSDRKRIMFVDDEREVLDGLRQSLYRTRAVWDLAFAESADAAIAALELAPADALVTDIRMPGNDGVQLLATVASRWPDTARIALSGYSDARQAAALVPLAQQFLGKPTDASSIQSAIKQCLRVQELLRSQALRQAVGRIRTVPALPQVYQRLLLLARSDGTTTADIAEAISQDSGVAAKVLQIANSAFFRAARTIGSLEQAAAHLGLATLRDIALCAEVFREWRAHDIPPELAPARLQSHALSVALHVRELTRGRSWREEAFLAALLHDIGYWILLQISSQDLTRAWTVSRRTGRALTDVEREMFGTTHAEIGAYILGLWGLPFVIVEAVALHHDPRGPEACPDGVLPALMKAESLLEHEEPLRAATPCERPG